MRAKSNENSTLLNLEKKCTEFVKAEHLESFDSAHDLNHIRRVVKNAKLILVEEDADPEIVIPAAWLHDCIVLPKNHPDRKKASILAAEKAAGFLSGIKYPSKKIRQVRHAVEAHSYSAEAEAEAIEAQIVQDADRLDAIGAIGIARCLIIGGKLERPLYNTEDPLCKKRTPDDDRWTIDHFYEKLFKLPELMHTTTAKKEAKRRVRFMERYLKELKREI